MTNIEKPRNGRKNTSKHQATAEVESFFVMRIQGIVATIRAAPTKKVSCNSKACHQDVGVVFCAKRIMAVPQASPEP
jgi:hypothetical protein